MAAFGLPSLPKQAASRRAALTVKVHFPPTSTENQGCFWFETLIVLEPPNGTTVVSLNLLTFCACLNCRRALNSDLGKTTRGAPRPGACPGWRLEPRQKQAGGGRCRVTRCLLARGRGGR